MRCGWSSRVVSVCALARCAIPAAFGSSSFGALSEQAGAGGAADPLLLFAALRRVVENEGGAFISGQLMYQCITLVPGGVARMRLLLTQTVRCYDTRSSSATSRGTPGLPDLGSSLNVGSPARPCVHHLFPRRPPDVQRPAPRQQGNQSTNFSSFACSPLAEPPLLKETIGPSQRTAPCALCALAGPWLGLGLTGATDGGLQSESRAQIGQMWSYFFPRASTARN